ncbi:VOC family protein [Streptomyces sp. B-S-A8]|uniref:VOC family protein n=1 Tax=Streptomyces solicavernae TaxID=3043614 RepID=A0ABT6S010_9ACTN|nr:VOC family protein [Streptomyces sp. B-S-A8]MDI3390034.1 VOC family protein [Streptomyces sp. B-S-A8]
MFTGIRTIMIFAEDPEKTARWWGNVLDTAVHTDVNKDNGDVYAWLDIAGGIEFGFHPLDEKRNKRGASPVPYWQVTDVEAARQRLLDAGCTHHRGPHDVGDGTGRKIAQLTDPFGNVIGIDGF